MTQRAKPATPRARRSASERSSRRTLYLNIAFLAAILLGTATLIGAAFASYAGTHWAEVANVNGVSINRDQAQAAANVDLFKLTYQVSQLRDDLAAGRISQADYDAQNSTLTQAQQNVSSGVVVALADDELQRLLRRLGITITWISRSTLGCRPTRSPRNPPRADDRGQPDHDRHGTATDAEKTIAQQTAEAAYGQLLFLPAKGESDGEQRRIVADTM